MFGFRQFSGLLATIVVLILGPTACQHRPEEAVNQSAPSSPERLRSSFRRDLSRDEGAGGHTLRQHVGRSDEQLRERLEGEPSLRAASTYTDRDTAESVVGLALEENHDKIARWLARSGTRPNLVLDYDGDPERPVGRTLRRGENHSRPCSHAVVVLRWNGDSEYYVLTSYPECA
jgi:Bacterial CdiA-CT RNAse A domain